MWIAYNVKRVQEKLVALIASKRKIWHRTRLYVKVGWEKRRVVARQKAKEVEDAHYDFCCDFGENYTIF